MQHAGTHTEPEIAREESGPLRIPDDLVIGTMAGREHELQRRLLQTLHGGCERTWCAPHQMAIDADRRRRTQTRQSRLVHGERNAAGSEQFRVAGVILVIVRQHRTGHGSLRQKTGEGTARAWKAGVDEDPAHEIRAHVQASDSAAEAREANPLDIAEPLELDHATKVAWCRTTARRH